MTDEFRPYVNDAMGRVVRLKLPDYGDAEITLNRNVYSVEMEIENEGIWQRYIDRCNAGERAGSANLLLDALEPVMAVSDPDWPRTRLATLSRGYLASFLGYFDPRTPSGPAPTSETSDQTQTTTASDESSNADSVETRELTPAT